MTVGAHHGAHEIKLREIDGISINQQIPSQVEVGFWILTFIGDKMGNLSWQEPESWKIAWSGTNRVHPIPARDGLACEAQLVHGSSISGQLDLDPSGDIIDHHEICCSAAIDPIYKPSPESDSNGGREVFMVG
jgi:hypothetical protein